MLTPRPQPQWVMPVLVRGEGRVVMKVGFEEGEWRVVEWNTDSVVARNLALLQQQYADPVDAITLIEERVAWHHLALVTEGGREALIFLSPGSSLFPELQENPLQALPPDQVMRKLLAAECPPGMTC